MANLNGQLGRSWVKRAYASPSPTWGESVPKLWRETEISFERRAKALNEYGSMIGGATTVIWATTAHCEIFEVRAQELSVDFVHGSLLKHSWAIYTDYPDDNSKIPHQGDFARFQTADGKDIDLQIKHVYIKDGIADHMEVYTVEFE